MINVILFFACIIGVIVHAIRVEKKEKINYFDFCVFMILSFTPVVCMVDLVFG